MSELNGTVTTYQNISASLGTGYPVRGEKGDNAYAYFAYANSADGLTDFTITPESGKIYTYLGEYVSNSATQSTTASDYTWALLSDEPARVSAENARAVAETARVEAESARVDAESERVSAESARVEAEQARVVADKNRQTINEEQITRVQTLTTAAQTSATNAKTSETNAATSATNAKTSETNAKASEDFVSENIGTIAKEPVAQDILTAAKEISEQVGILVQADSDETIRKENEETRVANESARQTAEGQRNDNENVRIANEAARQSAEVNRDSSENVRISAETARNSAETNRANAESARVTAENARVEAESARVTAETARATAETERVNHETERQAALDKAVSAAETSATNAKTSETEIEGYVDTIAKEEAAQDILTVAQEISTRVQDMADSLLVAATEVTAADILAEIQACRELLEQILNKESEA